MDNNSDKIIIKSNFDSNVNSLDTDLLEQKIFNNNLIDPKNQNKYLIHDNNKNDLEKFYNINIEKTDKIINDFSNQFKKLLIETFDNLFKNEY